MSLIKAYLESGYSTAVNKEYDKALAVTLQAKGMLEKYLAKDWKFEFEYLFLTLHNLIGIQYRLRNMNDCVEVIRIAISNYQAYKLHKPLPKTTHNFIMTQDQAEYLSNFPLINTFRKYECRTYLQACILFSELGEHAKAFIHARRAAKLACKLLYDTLLVAKYQYCKKKTLGELKGSRSTERYKAGNTDIAVFLAENDSDKEGEIGSERVSMKMGFGADKEKIEYLEGVIPILEEILEKVKGKKTGSDTGNRARLMSIMERSIGKVKFGPPDMKVLYDGLPLDHFLFTSNLMTFTQLQILNPEDWKGSAGKGLEGMIESDNIIEQIMQLIISLYCISTELRFWDEVKQGDISPTKTSLLTKDYQPVTSMKKASELWIGRCLSFAFVYLPHNTPLTGQIFNIYSTVYDSTKIAIPEEEELDYQFRYLMPARGIQKLANNFIPIVKKGMEDDIEGYEALLFVESDQTPSSKRTLSTLTLFDTTNNKFYDMLLKNYAAQRKFSPNPIFTQSIKKFALKYTRPHSNSHLNRSAHRISSQSPHLLDSSFQKLQRIYLGSSFFKSTEDDNSHLDNSTTQKDNSESDLRILTEPAHIDDSQPLFKDLKIESKPSLNRLRPKQNMDFEEMRKSIKKISRAKDSSGLKPFELPIKVTKGIKMVRMKNEGGDEPRSADLVVNKSFEAINMANFSKSIVATNQEETVRKSLKRPGVAEEMPEEKTNYGQVLADIAERRNLKPFKSSIEGNLKKFFRKNMMSSEAVVEKGSVELKKSTINTSMDSLTKADKDRIKQKIEERLKSQNMLLPPRPGKVQSVTKFAIRSIGKIKPRVVTFDENNSMNSDDSRDRILNNSSIVTGVKVEESKGFGVLRSSSVGKREGKSKQKVVLFKKKSELL